MYHPSSPSVAPRYTEVLGELSRAPRVWLVTGVAGFMGSSLLEHLLSLRQSVVGLDNFSTGSQANLDEVCALHPKESSSFRLIRGDIHDLDVCRKAMAGVDVVLHHAGLGSTARSLREPARTLGIDRSGFLNVLSAARDSGVRRVVYGSSHSVYGDSQLIPHVEDRLGAPLSPYAVAKRADELYAGVFQRAYGLEVIGLRYFNVFGKRQNAVADDAPVVPRWIACLLKGQRCRIFGNGETSRDFCYVANAVQANLLAAVAPREATNEVYNIARGEATSLNELFRMIRLGLTGFTRTVGDGPIFEPGRSNDIGDSVANIDKARQLLGYVPTHTVSQGLGEMIPWYIRSLSSSVYAPEVTEDRVLIRS